MKSILENRPALKEEVEKIAEVAGYLWTNGWAERNGGNITVNITDLVDDNIRQMPAITEPIAIGEKLSHLRGTYFFCKGTGKRMRDLARRPMDNGSIIRILDDCEHYEIIADNAVMPTSELPSHLLVHDKQVETGSGYKATLHTHPIELVAMSHHRPFLEKDVLTRLLWSMIPETKAFCPLGLGVVPYELPGSVKLAEGHAERARPTTMSCCGRNTVSLPKVRTSWTPSIRSTCCRRAQRSTSTAVQWAMSPRA
jgi:rhamnulose-1-phosphate aldolase